MLFLLGPGSGVCHVVAGCGGEFPIHLSGAEVRCGQVFLLIKLVVKGALLKNENFDKDLVEV